MRSRGVAEFAADVGDRASAVDHEAMGVAEFYGRHDPGASAFLFARLDCRHALAHAVADDESDEITDEPVEVEDHEDVTATRVVEAGGEARARLSLTEARSSNTRSQPAAIKALSWRSRTWRPSVVETRV